MPAAARSVALVCLLALAGCGRTEPQQAGSHRGDSEQALTHVTVLRGESAGVLVCVTPLAANPKTAAWYQEKIAQLSHASGERTFLRLSLFHLGAPDSPPLKLDRLELLVAAPGGQMRALPLQDGPPDPHFQASTLPLKTLESFQGTELPVGAFLSAVTSLPGKIALDSVTGGVVRAGGLEIRLESDSLERTILEELLEFPRREAILASMASDSSESQTSVPEKGR
ncbi:MAG: hypothetical protein V2A76_00705 [Planctomycetota bacterium]